MKIIASGKKDGKKIIVEVSGQEKFEYRFNGEKDDQLEMEIWQQIGDFPVGGTYWPETEAMQILAVLVAGFYDRPPVILLAEGIDEEIPGGDHVF